MTWGDYKTYLVERLKFDFTAPFDVSDASARVVGTPFDSRAAQHLALFTRESFCLFGARLALTLTSLAGEFQIDLATAAAKPVFEPTRLIVNGTEPGHVRASEILGSLPTTIQSATPTRYGLINDYGMVFNSKLTAADAAAGGYIDGYYTHPQPDDDEDALDISSEHVEPATMFSAALMMEPVVVGDESARRLSYYKNRARQEARRIRGEMLERANRSY